MSPARRRQFYLLLALMVAGAAAELATIGSILPFLSLLTDPHGSVAIRRFYGEGHSLSPLAAGALLFMVLALIAGAFRLQLVRSVQDFSYRLGHEIMVEIQRRVLLQPYSFHLDQNSSGLLAAIEQVEVLVFDLILPSMQAMTAAFLALFIIAAMVWLSPFAALVGAIACVAVYAGASALARERLRRNSEVIGRAFNARMKIAQESLGNIRDIIIDGSEDLHVRQFREVDLELSLARAATGFIGAAPRYVIETVGIVVIAAVAVWLSGHGGTVAAALPTLGAIAFAAQRLLPLLQQSYNGWATASGYFSVLSRTTDLLRLPLPAEVDAGGDPLPLNDRITLDDLAFEYPTRSSPALQAITFEIPAGSAVALAGETGSGKSTLADLLMGLLEPASGRILIDGRPLTAANRRNWQRSIAHVPQTIFLADTTIARNIALALGGEEGDLDRVKDAARKAQLDEFIESLPDGYDTVVGERGVRLSGGQRQRLGLARAIYKQAPMLVLDEATSALDEQTEAAVMDSLDALKAEGRTILFIAHRASTVARADIIVRLSGGRVAEVTGTRD